MDKKEEMKIISNIIPSVVLSNNIYKYNGRKIISEECIFQEYITKLKLNILERVRMEIYSIDFDGRYKYADISVNLDDRIYKFKEFCGINYIVKKLKNNILPDIIITLNNLGYRMYYNIDSDYFLNIKIYWKNRKFKTLVKCLIIFNKTYKDYINSKYSVGSALFLEAEKRFKSNVNVL